jgi:hypothetical protein
MLTHVNVKVKKYNNHNDNIIITISITNFSKSTPSILRDDCNDKPSLIIESVVVTRINIHPTREEPDQHVIHLTLGGSHV